MTLPLTYYHSHVYFLSLFCFLLFSGLLALYIFITLFFFVSFKESQYIPICLDLLCSRDDLSHRSFILQTKWPSECGTLTESTSLHCLDITMACHCLQSNSSSCHSGPFVLCSVLSSVALCWELPHSGSNCTKMLAVSLTVALSGSYLFLTCHSLCLSASYPVTLWPRDRSSKNEL